MKLLEKVVKWFTRKSVKPVEVVIQPEPAVVVMPVTKKPTRAKPGPKKTSAQQDAPAKKPRIYNENKPKKK